LSHRKYENAGTEFYEKDVLHLIAPYLSDLGIQHHILTDNEIYELSYTPPTTNNNVCMNPLDHQTTAMLKIYSHFQHNNTGKILWACGLGKALLSIFAVKMLKSNTCIIGVPTEYLQIQMCSEILNVFPDEKNIMFVGGKNDDSQNVVGFIAEAAPECKFIITTYSSCYKLLHIPGVDFKIGDEAHRLVGEHNEHGFRQFHRIPSNKTLFMSATEKTGEGYSMDDSEVFGKCIDKKSVKWAIDHKKITDYSICIIKNTEDDVEAIMSSVGLCENEHKEHRELFLSCFMAIKCIQQYDNLTHILLYTNKQNDAEIAQQFIAHILLSSMIPISSNDIYNRALHSDNCTAESLKTELRAFVGKKYGIISCVHMFGEGVSIPELNGVCIAANMQSEVRITQYLLRPNRLDKRNPDKRAFVIIPYIDTDDWGRPTPSYDKVRNIIYQLRNEDDIIEQKIKLFETQVDRERKRPHPHTINININVASDMVLESLKIRLRRSNALKSSFTEEEDEYAYVKSINIRLCLMSKHEYVDRETEHCNYIADAESYFRKKGVWKKWYDFLGINTESFIGTLAEWRIFCNNNHIQTVDEYEVLCNTYSVLPKMPGEFYIGFTNLQTELSGVKRR
jgi:superfamily II DNA or RNA helicase